MSAGPNGDDAGVITAEPRAGRRRPADLFRRKPVGLRPSWDPILGEVERFVPDLVAAVRNRWASFDQLVDAYEGREGRKRPRPPRPVKEAFVQIYPLVRQTFVDAHGELLDMYPSSRIAAYAALTKPRGSRLGLRRGPRPGFHFIYDLAAAPIAGQMFSRITQLAYDAKRIVPGRVLAECLDQLYSATTDLIGILEDHTKDSDRALEMEKLAIIQRDLDQVELRYLQITARLWYFVGVLMGTGLAILGTFAIGTAAHLSSVDITAVGFSAIGATLSVVQKISDDSLTVRYVVGPFYLWFLGLVRPVIGAFAGLLLQLAMAAGLIPLSLSGTAGEAYVLLAGFAVGWAERSIPDIFSRVGFSRGLPTTAAPIDGRVAADGQKSGAAATRSGRRSAGIAPARRKARKSS